MTNRFWGRKALDFVDDIQASITTAAVKLRFEAAIAEFGFHAYIMAGIPVGGRKLEQLTLANGWPSEWFSTYVREDLAAVDPIPRHSLRSLDPFEWRDAPYDREHDLAAKSVMDRAVDFQFNEGFCIPVHYDDAAAAISMAGDHIEIGPSSRGALHLMAVFAHGRLRSLTRPMKRQRVLSKIEAETLRWAAAGKTIWETSIILRLSERNVKFHLSEAQRKLGTANKTSTVAQAIVADEIRL